MATCTHCGSTTTGAFCGSCGTPISSDAASTATAPTGQGNRWQEQPTQGVPQGTPVSQAGAPYEGYRSVGASGQQQGYGTPGPQYLSGSPVMGETGPGGPVGTTGSTTAGGRRGGSQNQILAMLVGGVGVLALALMAYLVMKPGADPNPGAAGASGASSPSTQSASSSPTSSSPTATSGAAAPSAAAPAPQSATTPAAQAPSVPADTAAPVAPAPQTTTTDGSQDSGSDTSSDDGAGVSALPGLVTTTSSGGTTYGATRSGSSLTVYQDGASGPESLGTVSLPGSGSDITFLTLSGCSKPIVVFNAATGYSAAFGYDGSGYQAYKGSSDGSMTPSGGSGAGFRTYGVNRTPDGKLEYRDTSSVKRGHGNMFDSCLSSSPDVLHKSN